MKIILLSELTRKIKNWHAACKPWILLVWEPQSCPADTSSGWESSHSPTEGSRPAPLSSGLEVFTVCLYSALARIILSFERWPHCQLSNAGGKSLWRMLGWEGSTYSGPSNWSGLQICKVGFSIFDKSEKRIIKIIVTKVYVWSCERDVGFKHICKQSP